jgi:Fe-S cluster assembly protein SufD
VKKVVKRTVSADLNEKFLVQASGNDQLVVQLNVLHGEPNTSSNVAICVVASGHARVAVGATAIIEKSAKNTSAWLEVRVITSGNAIVTAAPNLKIKNHNVKAGHALTTKHITNDELFYLTSRGLSRRQAERLVLNGFVAPFKEGTIIS